MRNYKWSARHVDYSILNEKRIEWIEIEEWYINGRILKRARECSTDIDRRGILRWCDNAGNYIGGGIYTDEARCIDLSKCKTLDECKRGLNRYYEAVNASPDKKPGDIIA